MYFAVPFSKFRKVDLQIFACEWWRVVCKSFYAELGDLIMAALDGFQQTGNFKIITYPTYMATPTSLATIWQGFCDFGRSKLKDGCDVFCDLTYCMDFFVREKF